MQMTFTAHARVSPGIHFHKDTLWRSDERSFAPPPQKKTALLNGEAAFILQSRRVNTVTFQELCAIM